MSSPTTSNDESVYQLMRGVLLFVLADIFFTGFGAAYAYASHQLTGVLLFLFVGQAASPISYITNLHLLRKGGTTAVCLLRWGNMGMFLSVLLAGLMEGHALAVLVMAMVGGGARGIAFCSRTWLEIKHTSMAVRERYLSRLESIATVFKVVVPLLASAVLTLSQDQFAALFICAGMLGVGLSFWGISDKLHTEPTGPIALRRTLCTPGLWTNAPFFMIDGASYAMRNALFVSGAMAVVGSAAGYAGVEAGASILAASLLWWLSLQHKTEPSMVELRNSLLLLAMAWCSLVVAIIWPWALVGFVASYALANPLVTMCKGGLTLKGLSSSELSVQDSMAARMLLLTVGRFTSLGLALLISLSIEDSRWRLVGLSGLALLLVPLEYFFAARVARGAAQPEAASPTGATA